VEQRFIGISAEFGPPTGPDPRFPFDACEDIDNGMSNYPPSGLGRQDAWRSHNLMESGREASTREMMAKGHGENRTSRPGYICEPGNDFYFPRFFG